MKDTGVRGGGRAGGSTSAERKKLSSVTHCERLACDGLSRCGEMEPTPTLLHSGRNLSRRHRRAFPFLRPEPATAITAPALKEGQCSARKTCPPAASGHAEAMLVQKLLKSGRTEEQPAQPFRWTFISLLNYSGPPCLIKGSTKAHGHVNPGVYLFIYLFAHLLLLL